MRKHDGWVLEGPDGALWPETFHLTKEMCWSESFPTVCAQVQDFERQYWKKWDASIRAARKVGFQMVKVRFERVGR